jgi:hypothetical protein
MAPDTVERLRQWNDDWPAWKFTEHQQRALAELLADHARLRQQVEACRAETIEECARVADKHLARIPGHCPDKEMADKVAQGYGNAALNIACELRSLVKEGGSNA